MQKMIILGKYIFLLLLFDFLFVYILMTLCNVERDNVLQH